MGFKLARNLPEGVGMYLNLNTPRYPWACSVAHDGNLGLKNFKSELNDVRCVSNLAGTFWKVSARI